MYQTTIPVTKVSKDKVVILLKAFQEIAGKPAQIEECLLVSTDDINLSAMFDSVADVIRGNGKNSAKEPKGQKAPKAPKETKAMGRASRRIVETGEIYSLVELKKWIKAGVVSDGTVVENSRGERFVVMDGELIKEPQS